MFDYFKDNICRKLVKFLIEQTRKNGVFYITNVHENNFFRNLMEFAGRWEVIHRNDEQFLSFVPENYSPELISDKTHTNIYVKGCVRTK
jgi:hypothetical protein